jgi:3-hydroxyisobutyrate dehydrogenase-like beta-hydroxyacid dehydrogenase
MSNVGFIGLGAMGEPMVANLLKNGHSVNILGTRSPGPVGRLKELGAAVFESPSAAADGCSVVVLALPTSTEVEEVVTGAGGLAEGMVTGSVVVDCTTGDPTVTRAMGELLKKSGVGMVDAGLTRGVAGAKNGKLAYFVGGAADDFEKAKPVLEAMGDTFFMMGGLGTGHEAKIISNTLSYGTVALVNEALMLGRSFGLDLEKLQEALMAGAMSKALEAFGPTIIAGNFDTPRVSIKNAGIHMSLIKKLAEKDNTPLYVMPAAGEVYQLASERGDDEKDMAVISEIWTDPKN